MSMASTSSSSSSKASPATDNSTRYDVFLSFRGEDTHNSFTDHLYDALVRAGFHTFRDDDEIERGEEVKLGIVRAIEASDASIVLLSANYANSTWCLDELRLILEERRVRNHFVLPVFYHVDPSDVRKQSKDFMIQVKSCGRWSVHNVNMWKAALTEVADLAGLVLSGPETIFMKKIVDTIYNKLDRKQVYLPPNLIGMDARLKEINSWLKHPDRVFLVICGIGGSGKTTLARYIVYSNWKNFDNISIVEDIGSRCKEPHDLLLLQEKLFGDILGGKKRKIPSVCQGTYKIEEALQKRKALIVLDDIVEQSQLFALLGSGDINKESKIVITTRENSTCQWFESRPWRCQEYKMELLNDDESLELFSLHAFRSKIVMEGYEELAKKVLKYCEGNPLALEVLGSSLQEDNSIASWKSALNLLEKDIHPGIHRVLIRSYNLLPYDTDRELFLHIACFFIGIDIDYVVKILEHDYSATSRIKTLTKRCLLSISPNKKLLMHPLLQEMGRTIVNQESPKNPAKRSRVWCNKESYDLLRKGKGSKTMEGLALDMKILREGKYALKASNFRTDSLKNMDKLKLLQLKYVELTGSYENFSEHLRWICWLGFPLRTIPRDLFLENLVALDMSYSCLEIFEPPMALQSLQILNLKDSHNLCEIRNISLLPNLETLILWNCHNLSYVCETIACLKSLVLLNMTGCENLCKISGKIITFSLPHTLQRLLLKDCYIECADFFPLRFSVPSFLQYLNLGNSLFEFLPDYNHLKSLRVLDLTLCSRLKRLLCLPSTLAELYVYYCVSLEKITFQSCQFTLQEFGYEGCTSLCDIEGFIKLMPLAKLDEADLGHMKWLKEYQNHEVCLVGDDELTIGRHRQLQMLYEFNIISTSLPDIKNANLMPKYISESPSLSFDVPLCPKDKRLKGLNITFKYTALDVENWAWFAKISTTNGVDLMYSPRVFGKPAFGEVTTWFSYWPIGNTLEVGDQVNVSIIVVNGLEIRECGANLVYTDEVANEAMQNDMELIDLLGGGCSRFQLSTGAYYLCRRDFSELMEAVKGTPSWFRSLVGDTIDYTEVRGWRKTGRPQQSEQSFTELKTIRCIIHGPESEQFYKIAEMSKPSFVNKTVDVVSSIHETLKSVSSDRRFHIEKDIQSHGEEESKDSAVPLVVEWADTEQGQTRKAQEAQPLENVDSTQHPSLLPLDELILESNKTLTKSFEDGKDRNPMITIASMKSKLSKPIAENDQEEVIRCLEELQKLCEERVVHREWIVLEDYIPSLVDLLGSKSREIRTRTLILLRILAKDSDDAKVRIAKVNGVAESIVRSLGRRISEGTLAVELLLELSRNETFKNYIGRVQGCILLLVTMSNSDYTQAATQAHELLDQLSFSDQNVIQMAKANYFRHLLRRLSSGSEEVKMCMVTTLAEMELTDHNKSYLFKNGAFDSLIHLVSQGNPRMKETAAKALRNLSSLPENSTQMIKNGSVNVLVNLLYNHTSSHCLQEELAAIIMQLAMSTMSQNCNEAPVSLFESDGDIDSLFSFIGVSRPSVQESLLHSFYAMCHSPLAETVKTRLIQKPESIQLVVLLFEKENHKVRAKAVKLFYCLTEDGDDKEIVDRMGLQSVETLIQIIKSSTDEEEIASAMGVISNLTQSSQLTKSLLKADGLPVIFSCLHKGMQNRPHNNQLIENTVGSLCHFTIPTSQDSQKKVGKTGFIPLLVQLLELGTSLTKRKACISLGQLSRSSFELSQPIRPLGRIFRWFSRQSGSACPAHLGICTVEASFCLVEADAVSPLVRLLEDPDLNVCEASFDALMTLIEAERLPYGAKVLDEANAIRPIIKLLNCSSSSLLEKVLNELERLFRLLDLKQNYGNLAQMPLVDLTQRGNNRTKNLAARILGQLNVLHEISSYF